MQQTGGSLLYRTVQSGEATPSQTAGPLPPAAHLPSAALTNNCILFRKVLFSAYTEMMHYKLLCDPHVFRGHAYLYICVHMYLRYFFFSLEFVFVFGSMRIWAEDSLQPACSIWLKTILNLERRAVSEVERCGCCVKVKINTGRQCFPLLCWSVFESARDAWVDACFKYFLSWNHDLIETLTIVRFSCTWVSC